MRLTAVGKRHEARQFNKFSDEKSLSEVWHETRAFIRPTRFRNTSYCKQNILAVWTKETLYARSPVRV